MCWGAVGVGYWGVWSVWEEVWGSVGDVGVGDVGKYWEKCGKCLGVWER